MSGEVSRAVGPPGRFPVRSRNGAAARRAHSGSGGGPGIPFGREDAALAVAARLSSRRRMVTGARAASKRAPRSGVSRPWKQNAPSASVHELNVRALWIRTKVAWASSVADVARALWQRSLTTWRGSESAPASRAPSTVGSRMAAWVISVRFGPDSRPLRRASSHPAGPPAAGPLPRCAWPDRRSRPRGRPVDRQVTGDRTPPGGQTGRCGGQEGFCLQSPGAPCGRSRHRARPHRAPPGARGRGRSGAHAARKSARPSRPPGRGSAVRSEVCRREWPAPCAQPSRGV